MNPLYSLVTITPEIIEKLEDNEEYCCIKTKGENRQIAFWSGKDIKWLHSENRRKVFDKFEIYLPHTEEKKVSEERLNSIADEIIEANSCSNSLSFQEAKTSVLAALSYFSVSPPSSQVSEEQIISASVRRFGNDIHLFAQQRDGFIEGYKAALLLHLPIR